MNGESAMVERAPSARLLQVYHLNTKLKKEKNENYFLFVYSRLTVDR